MHGTLGAAGAILGGGFGVLARRAGPRREARALAAGLVIAAAIYLWFALAGGGSPRDVALEAGGLAAFGSAALLGIRLSPLWLAAGWLLHAGWDVGLHSTAATPFVPAWYPPLCVGFDLVLAVWIAARARILGARSGGRPT